MANCTDNCLASNILNFNKTTRYMVIFFISPPHTISKYPPSSSTSPNYVLTPSSTTFLLLDCPPTTSPLNWLHTPSVSVSPFTPHWPPLLASRSRRSIETWEVISVIALYAFLLDHSCGSTQIHFNWAVSELAAGTDCKRCLT